MATKHDLVDWLVEALQASDGQGRIVDLCKYVWKNYGDDLQASGDLFYTWQYDMRWAATELRKSGKIKSADLSPKGIWELSDK